ncbi:MAG TPA: NAD(P)/FAD-dependent oxidoreductase [Methylomirabilota bacterium]|nr:NAD(P)/FAD-dependent oxidoreductase [Methylomirabilota bacterium]
MRGEPSYDAVVVGAGPNGLAAAITVAAAGRSVLLLERADTVGGGTRSAALTLPGFVHDVCSAIHPLAVASPFFRTLPLAADGLAWIEPPVALAHPFDDEPPALLVRSVEATAATLGVDAGAYRRLMGPLVRTWPRLAGDVLRPLLGVPRHPLALARFGLRALRSARGLAERLFTGARARALLAGLAAHSMLPLETPGGAGVALVLGALGHAVGWPFPRGGAQRIADALAAHLRSLGGEIRTGVEVETLAALPASRLVLCDVTPRQLLALAGPRLPDRYRRRLAAYRYGPGVFKLDLALDGPIPWRDTACSEAGTVHVGGTLGEIADAERAVAGGAHPARPFVLLAQPTRFDPSRAPAGRHTVWAYCHVPSGSDADLTDAIERQVERFAPGFRDRILARCAHTARDVERENPNYVGGDINGGVQDLWQTLARPMLRPTPYATPTPGLYLCSSATPPGGGVHGMCGHLAARAALAALR